MNTKIKLARLSLDIFQSTLISVTDAGAQQNATKGAFTLANFAGDFALILHVLLKKFHY